MKEDSNEALDAINTHVDQVSVRVNALQERVKTSGYGTGDNTGGNSLLQLKTAVLLRYTANLVAFAALRVEGKPLDDELRSKLCADWATLDRIRPLEKRLRPQLDALVKAHNDVDNHRPNPAAMINASDSEPDIDSDGDHRKRNGYENEDKEDVYVPPRFTETVYADDEETTARIRADKEQKTKDRMLQSEGTKAMLAELRGLPEKIKDSVPRQSKAVMNQKKGRDRFEEDNFIRLARTKQDRKSEENAMKQAAIADGDYGMDGLVKLADGVSRKIKNSNKRTNKKSGSNRNEDGDEMEREKDMKERALEAMYGSGSSAKKRKKRKSSDSATLGKKRRA